MATFTDLAKSYGCEIKQKSAYKNTAETLNEKFEKYWTSLFKDEKTTDRWVNDWSADCEILIPISERGEKYFLIVKNTPINRVEYVGIKDRNSLYYSESKLRDFEQILDRLVALKLEKDFEAILKESSLGNYMQFQNSDFRSAIAAMKCVLGDKEIVEDGNSIIISGKEVDCGDLLFLEKYYTSSKTLDRTPGLEQGSQDTSLQIFNILQKHNEYKLILETILNNLAEAYWASVEKNLFSAERYNKIKEKFEQFQTKHKMSEYYGLNAQFEMGTLVWGTHFLLEKESIYKYLESNYKFLKYMKNISDETFSLILENMERDLLRMISAGTVSATGQAILYNCLFKIDQLKNIKQDFKETVNYKGEDITIAKTHDYFIMNYKDYLCVHFLPNDRMFSFSSPSLNPNNIECLKDFEEAVEKDVEFLIEFLNS